jgi:diguanylate cyclase (GGDEF)-like protein
MKSQKNRTNRLSKRIVSMTVFFTAIFLVLVMAVLAFLYVSQATVTRQESAMTSSRNVVSSLQSFVFDTSQAAKDLAVNPSIIEYVNLVSTGAQAIPQVGDAHYLLYQNVMNLINAVEDYAPAGLYDFVFIAMNTPCSSGLDGCYVGTKNAISNETWNLTSRPWYQEYLTQESGLLVTHPYIDQRSGEYTVSYIQPIMSDNQVIGYLGIDTLLSTIPAILDKYDYLNNPLKETIIMHRTSLNEQTLLYTSKEELNAYFMKTSLQIQALDEEFGYINNGLYALTHHEVSLHDQILVVNVAGINYDGYFASIEGSNMMVLVLHVNPPLMGIEVTFAALVGSVVLLTVLISMFLSARINKTLSPIGDILTTLDEIKKGNFGVRLNVRDNNELRNVADAINIMSHEIGEQVDLVYRSYVYDSITGLKNRRASHEQIETDYFSSNEKSAVLLIDVDNLKNINVTKGQSVGDEILKAFAKRLQQSVKNPDAVYFNGSNEFIFIIPKVKNLEVVEAEILRVFDKFRTPIEIKNLKIDVRSSIGVAVYPYDGKNMDELIKKCDTALFKAKETGKGKFIFYNDQLTREVIYKAQINEQLNDALQKGQLYLKYQPLIDNRNEIYGFEALVRWNSPTLGEISPQVFIANAEESQMIIPIGNWILKEACRAQVEIFKQFNKPFVMSVNVSPVQMLQQDFIDILRSIIKETDIDPHCLVLEITENVVMESSYLLDKTIEYIHEIGAKIALDDFGTGYASLTYLRQLPFDNLKIDKSFVDGIFASKKDHSIIGTIVELVHNLNMKVVAEGVETRKQYEFLKQITTDIFQGYLFSKPLHYDDLIQYIDQFYKVSRQKRIDVFANKDYTEPR